MSSRGGINVVKHYLRITENRKSRFISTGISIEPEDWNEQTDRVRRSHPRYKTLNGDLEHRLFEAQGAAIELRASRKKALTAKAVKQELTGTRSRDFFGFAQQYIDDLDAAGKYWEWKKAQVLRQKVRAFQKGRPLSLDEIDASYIVRFERYMREEKKNRTNTVQKNLQILHRMMKRAVRDEVIGASDNPFLHYKIKSEKTYRSKLTIEQVRDLEQLELPHRSALWHTRNYFLFSFYCAGIRFGDICCLRWKNIVNGRLEYRMNKTGTPKSIKMVPQAKVILKEYERADRRSDDLMFPLLRDNQDYSDPRYLRRQISSRNATVNSDLKKLADQAGIGTNLSFHISRHTFADYARTQGMDLYSISKALAHSNLKTTELYLKSFDSEAVDSAMDSLFSGDLLF